MCLVLSYRSNARSHRTVSKCRAQQQPFRQMNIEQVQTLYRSCAALARFSGTFDLILFEAVNFKFIIEKVW